jgi:hypothetical protein
MVHIISNSSKVSLTTFVRSSPTDKPHSHISQISLPEYSERGVGLGDDDDEVEGDFLSSRVSTSSTILSFGPGVSSFPSFSAINVTFSPGSSPGYSKRMSSPSRTWTRRPVWMCRISTNSGEKRRRWAPTWANEVALASHRTYPHERVGAPRLVM